MNTPTTLSVLVPAYNEPYLVYASLERLKILAESPLLERIEVIIVDDGSTDQTPSVLREFERSVSAEPNAKMKWVFLRHEVNQGKAAAICTALQSATAELAVTHDADLEYHPLDLLKLVQVFLDEQADTVLVPGFLRANTGVFCFSVTRWGTIF